MSSKKDPASERSQTADSFGGPMPVHPGSFTERYVKCSKPGCACAVDEGARHGP